MAVRPSRELVRFDNNEYSITSRAVGHGIGLTSTGHGRGRCSGHVRPFASVCGLSRSSSVQRNGALGLPRSTSVPAIHDFEGETIEIVAARGGFYCRATARTLGLPLSWGEMAANAGFPDQEDNF